MFQKIRVLIVDDNDGFRNTLREFIEGLDNVQLVGEAENGKQAVELGLLLNPDLVLMDVHMPELDGKKACMEIKRTKTGAAVVLYSMDTTSLQYGCREAGADGCLAKDELFDKIRNLRSMHCIKQNTLRDASH